MPFTGALHARETSSAHASTGRCSPTTSGSDECRVLASAGPDRTRDGHQGTSPLPVAGAARRRFPFDELILSRSFRQVAYRPPGLRGHRRRRTQQRSSAAPNVGARRVLRPYPRARRGRRGNLRRRDGRRRVRPARAHRRRCRAPLGASPSCTARSERMWRRRQARDRRETAGQQPVGRAGARGVSRACGRRSLSLLSPALPAEGGGRSAADRRRASRSSWRSCC